MTRRLRLSTLITGIAFVTIPVFAYKQPTHELMAVAAVQQSALMTDHRVLSKLGLSLTTPLPDGEGARRSVLNLIRFGANAEDENGKVPHGARSLNHFFNPLTGSGLIFALPSPDWALEDRGDLSAMLVGEQVYSYRDARRYMYDALTARDPAQRETAWGLTFRSLGHVIHHVQDMAQPQHVRNDWHCDLAICPRHEKLNSTLYEEYTDERRQIGGLQMFDYDPVYSVSDTSTFNSPRKFWTTQGGKGIADYANRGFVSAGTNFNAGRRVTGPVPPFIFPAEGFPNPNTALMNPEIEVMDITDPSLLGPNQPLRGKITFVHTAVNDAFRPDPANAINSRASTYSIFSEDLKPKGSLPNFVLNRFNFDAAHTYLMKRAVGYSAGLLNYFFRGSIECRRDQAVASGCRIRNLGPETMNGRFEFFYDTVDGIRLPVPNARWDGVSIQPSDPANPNDGFVASFTPPIDPAPLHRGNYVLAFSGDAGEEKSDPAAWIGSVVGLVIESHPSLAPGSSDHSLAVSTSHGFAYGWGRNTHGEVGTGGYEFAWPYGKDGPVVVKSVTSPYVPLLDVVAVAKGAVHSLALLRDGTVVGWGANFEMQTGSNRNTFIELLPVPVAGLSDVTAIAAGGIFQGGTSQSMALKRDGTIWAWGGNAFGQVGNGSATTRAPYSVPVPVQVVGLTHVIDIAAGGGHSLGLTSSGTVWSWGKNWSGQLGNGAFQPNGTIGGTGVPAPVVGVSQIIAIAAGGSHSLALKADGTVWSWGMNYYGQLGNGGFEGASPYGISRPVLVAGLSDVIAIAAGGNHSLALKRDGTVWAWGDNSRGQIGTGGFGIRETLPTRVTVVSDIIEIAGGNTFSLALKRDGVVWSWGGNEYGELGQGGFDTRRPVPAPSAMFVTFP